MPRIICLILLSLFFANALKGREQITTAVSPMQDSLPHILLKEVKVTRNTKNNAYYKRQNRRHQRLEYNVRKVYPYACIASRKIEEIDRRIRQVSRPKERRKIIRQEYGELMKTFKKPLMKLSITQGRILIRLIYRETHNSAFAHIREYKGSVNAYFWQSIALLFGNNLKADYDPHGKDAGIEEIVQTILAEKENKIGRQNTENL